MDFQRLFLFLIFSFSALLLWDGWQKYQHPLPSIQTISAISPNEIVEKVKVKTPELNIKTGSISSQFVNQGKKIHVSTDVLKVEINTVGGTIQRVDLLQHKDALDTNKPFSLLQQQNERMYIAQSGLLGQGLPDHNAEYNSTFQDYQLKDGNESIEVRLVANDNVAKIITFHRGSYVIDVKYEIRNLGSAPLVGNAYFQLVRDNFEPAGGSKLVPTYTGPAIYTDEKKFQKIEFSSIDKNKTEFPKNSDNGWVAMLQHYFVTAWIPAENIQRENYTKALGNNQYAVGAVQAISPVEPGQLGIVGARLYVGPATSNIEGVAKGLGLTVDYGWLTIIATPLFWFLTLIQSWVHNWGVAIIVLTVLIKLVFFPLSAASYRSMAKMRIVAPKLEKIKQQYGEDREKLNRAMMELYKTEKINPLGGCLPMVIQIPVFISLYWAILSSVELRHAPFFGWITDLSASDPFYVLPAIMGISMIIQSKLSPAPPDPLQAKLMRLMPVVFSVVFFFFPAGLVLYSVVNNLLSIAQQWFITRNLEVEQKVGA